MRASLLVLLCSSLLCPVIATGKIPTPGAAPPIAEIVANARALLAGSSPDQRAALEAEGNRLMGLRVANWAGWVIGTFRESSGLTYGVHLAAEDPYAQVVERKRQPGRGRFSRFSLADRPAYLVLTGLPSIAALRPGQKFLIEGRLAEADLVAGVRLVLDGIRLREAPGEGAVAPVPDDLKDLQIALSRGGCLGRCPVYTVSVTGDGAIRWKGDAFVQSKGPQSGQLEPARLLALVAAFARAGFSGLRDGYENRLVTDQASTIVTFRRGKETKSVRHYHGDYSAPVKLTILENQIDAILGTADWIEGTR